MTLMEKIKSLYPDIEDEYFGFEIMLFDITDSGYTIPDDAVSVGNCVIMKWNHPTLTKPTQAQLDAITE
jgi:hypothetical protein